LCPFEDRSAVQCKSHRPRRADRAPGKARPVSVLLDGWDSPALFLDSVPYKFASPKRARRRYGTPVTKGRLYTSNAPISVCSPGLSRRVTPRWSVTGARALSAAPIAGLPASKAIVMVGPPLFLFCSGPSMALIRWLGLPTILPFTPLTTLLPHPLP